MEGASDGLSNNDMAVDLFPNPDAVCGREVRPEPEERKRPEAEGRGARSRPP